MITTLDGLRAQLSQAQLRRDAFVRLVLCQELSARLTDAALTQAFVAGLPMAQGVQQRVQRSRGAGAVITAKLRYREGVRMLDSLRTGSPTLTGSETAALAIAREVTQNALLFQDEEARFREIYAWVCRSIRYAHTAPGQKGYDRLVGAASVLEDRQANCQGFADVMYLLCGLCGMPCEFRCGPGKRRLHVWNAVFLNGLWRDADASLGARMPAE